MGGILDENIAHTYSFDLGMPQSHKNIYAKNKKKD